MTAISKPVLRKPLQKRSRERVDRILKTAAKLLADRDPDQISIREIADEADVSPGTIYQFFDDKRAIFDALGSSFERAIAEGCEKAVTAELARRDTRLYVETLLLTINAVQRHHEGFVCILRDAGNTAFSPLAARVRERLNEHLIQTLGEAFDNIPTADLIMLVSIFEASLLAIMARMPERGSLQRERYTVWSVELLTLFLQNRSNLAG